MSGWRAALVGLAAIGYLVSCGFHLRGLSGPTPVLSQNFWVQSQDDDTAVLARLVRDRLRSWGGEQAASREGASVMLDILEIAESQRVLTYRRNVRIAELLLTSRLRYRIQATDTEPGAAQTMEVESVLVRDQNNPLVDEARERMLREEMRGELVELLLTVLLLETGNA